MALGLAAVALVLAFGEAIAFVGARLLSPDFYYVSPSRDEFARQIAEPRTSPRFHPVLGWAPSGERGTPTLIARNAPDSRGAPCLSLYGDSFVFADEVPDRAAWGNQLARRLGCRVDNYGVSGYGTDQAFIRMTLNRANHAPRVILGHLSENIVRNVNRERGLIYGAKITPKPRFVLAGDKLTMLPPPWLAESDYDRYKADMRGLLPHEFFIPGASASSKRTLGFPYLYRLPRAFGYARLQAGLLALAGQERPWFAEFYEPAHPSDALRVTLEILTAFADEARARGQEPMIILIPTARDIAHFIGTGQWVYGNLAEAAERRGLPVANIGAAIVERLGIDALSDRATLCRHFCTSPLRLSGHYTAEGNRLMAGIMADILADSSSVAAR